MMGKKHVWYWVLVINTHMDQGLRNGIIQWCRKHVMRRVNVIFFSEVSNVPLLRDMLGPDWWIVSADSETSGTNYVALKDKSRWERPEVWDKEARHGSRHGRSTRGIRAWDRKARRHVVFSSLHPDPLGLGFRHADPGARAVHIRQVEDTVDFHKDQGTVGAVDISAGDANESLDLKAVLTYPKALKVKSAVAQFATAGMYPSHRTADNVDGQLRLMEAFIGKEPYVEVTRSEAVDPTVKGMDHEVRAVWIKVRKGAR